MTDGKGIGRFGRTSRSTSTYVHVKERRKDGIVLRGAKAIINGAPYMHEYLVMPCRNMIEADKDFAICCAVPIDADGITIGPRRPGWAGEVMRSSAPNMARRPVCDLRRCLCAVDRVFMDGEWSIRSLFQPTQPIIGTVASAPGCFAELIGAGVLMSETNGLSVEDTPHLRDGMVDLIKIVKGFMRRCRRLRLWLCRSGGEFSAGRRLCKCRQVDAGDADLRHAPDRA